MMEQERQQQEIEHLQKKIKALSKAYSDTLKELEQHRQGEKKMRKKGRPSTGTEKRHRSLRFAARDIPCEPLPEKPSWLLAPFTRLLRKLPRNRKGSMSIWIEKNWQRLSKHVRLHIINFTNDMVSRAFGINENPNWADFNEFLESRCMPRIRYGIREESNYIGIDVYDHFQIIEKTSGRVHKDGQSMEHMNSDWVKKYDEIRKNVKDDAMQKEQLQKHLEGNKGRWMSYEIPVI